MSDYEDDDIERRLRAFGDMVAGNRAYQPPPIESIIGTSGVRSRHRHRLIGIAAMILLVCGLVVLLRPSGDSAEVSTDNTNAEIVVPTTVTVEEGPTPDRGGQHVEVGPAPPTDAVDDGHLPGDATDVHPPTEGHAPPDDTSQVPGTPLEPDLVGPTTTTTTLRVPVAPDEPATTTTTLVDLDPEPEAREYFGADFAGYEGGVIYVSAENYPIMFRGTRVVRVDWSLAVLEQALRQLEAIHAPQLRDAGITVNGAHISISDNLVMVDLNDLTAERRATARAVLEPGPYRIY